MIAQSDIVRAKQLIDDNIQPGEDVDDILAGAIRTARRRAEVLRKEPDYGDIEFVLSVFTWNPLKPRVSIELENQLRSIRRWAFAGAASGSFGNLERILPERTLELPAESLFEAHKVGLEAFLAPEAPELAVRLSVRELVRERRSRPLDLLQQIPLFSDLSTMDLERVAASMKERQFEPGETLTVEGSGGAGFFVIEEGDARVTVHDEERGRLGAGDYFGEISLITERSRTATITAETPIKAWGLTMWDFRPLVEENAEISWKVLQGMAKQFRGTEAVDVPAFWGMRGQ
jgi:hypothetical protein